MDSFARDGLTFDLLDQGPRHGQAFVLLHGFPENLSCWDRVTPGLVAAGYRVLAPNQRGYSPGARPRPVRAYRARETVLDVLALADQAGLDRFHLVGHDWGGAVAWGFAGRFPERLHTLTSLSTPHPRAFRRALLTSGQWKSSLYMGFFQLRGPAERALLQGHGRRFVGGMARTGLDREYGRRYFEHLREPGAMTAVLNWYRALQVRSSAAIPSITVPTLYVWSTADTALGRTAAELTRRYVTGPYRFEVLEGVSHWIPEQVPQDVVRLVLEHARDASA